MSRTRTALVSLTAVAALSLGLTACESDTEVTSTANQSAASDTGKKSDAPKKDSGKGGTGRYEADLLAKLKTAPQGTKVSEVRVKKSGDDYSVTINSTFTSSDKDNETADKLTQVA